MRIQEVFFSCTTIRVHFTLGSVLYILGGGICLAYTYKKTNNLLVPWGIHVLNNSFYLLVNFQL
ncbi:CPBP family intramembrane glutamic endopeptidase [Bacillus cereus]|uniref:CPBP family intramembrane glutamic endopeptidase n=1 Tax=Bacillus cereus TaxID=1396 RepID=UPI0030822D84